MSNKLKLSFAALAVGAMMAPAAFAEEFITIGTGGVTGVYYPTGGAICRLVNKGRKEHGIRCSVESTGGSIYNINTIREGELEFGVAQSDWQHHAYNGTSKFEDAGAFEGLRAVFSVHPEPFTVVARADSGITTFDDLKGKRVNIGNPGSGQRGTMEVLLGAKGWTTDDFALATELKAAEQSAALCDNQIDAMVYTVGHPSGSIQEATTACDSVLVTVSGAEVDGLIGDNAFYRTRQFPVACIAAMTRTQRHLVSAQHSSHLQMYLKKRFTSVVKSVMENIEDFRKLHPAFANLDPKEMATAGLSAPLHAVRMKYYKEAGLID